MQERDDSKHERLIGLKMAFVDALQEWADSDMTDEEVANAFQEALDMSIEIGKREVEKCLRRLKSY